MTVEKIRVLLAFSFAAALLFGCMSPPNQGEDDRSLYKGIPSAVIPGECLGSANDVCELFDCMVDSCWCEESPERVLKEGGGLAESEAQAIAVVNAYLAETGSGYSVERAAKLNNIFYNVFAYDAARDEAVFTVAADGTIIKTVCGV